MRDVVGLTGVPAHQLRRWERELLGFLPVVRTKGGQRRYTKESIERIRQIDHLVNGEGLSLVGARRRIEEGGEPEDEPTLADKLLRDKRVLQAIDQLAGLVRRKIFEEMGVSGNGSPSVHLDRRRGRHRRSPSRQGRAAGRQATES